MCTSGRGQVLIPWPNRLEDGKYEFDGREHQLPLTEPEHGNAIHGLVRWTSWSVARAVARPRRDGARAATAARLSVHARAQRRVRAVGTGAVGASRPPRTSDRVRCPFGAGAHPYLRLDTPTIDPLTLRVPAEQCCSPTSEACPIGTIPVDGTEFDFPRPASSWRRRSSTTATRTSIGTRTAEHGSRSRTRRAEGSRPLGR